MQSTTFFIFVAGFLLQATIIQAQRVDIVQTAINNGNFKTLVTALTAADLVDALKGAGPFTVFAPTDAAFARLPPGVVANLLKPENKPILTQILKYHVVSGNLTAAAIIALHPPVRVETLAGRSVYVTQEGEILRVNEAIVIIPNVFATNGIIHAIDAVLFPRELNKIRPRLSIPISDN